MMVAMATMMMLAPTVAAEGDEEKQFLVIDCSVLNQETRTAEEENLCTQAGCTTQVVIAYTTASLALFLELYTEHFPNAPNEVLPYGFTIASYALIWAGATQDASEDFVECVV